MWSWRQYPSRMRGGLIAALDIGSSKVCCAIAQFQGNSSFEILGFAQQLSTGVKSGIIIDMENVITSIVNAVHGAEKMAGTTIRDVIVSVNGAHLKSVNFSVELDVSSHPIDDIDINKILFQTKVLKGEPTLQVLHTFPTGYALDGIKGIKDPRKMSGDRLSVSVHNLLGKSNFLYNVSTCVARSHLDVIGLVAAPYASGLACLVEDEMELGVILIDMGGSTTSFAVFHEGQLCYTECIPMGGLHVTMDIARGFSTTLIHAERLKTLFGSAIHSATDDREMIIVPLVGEKRGEGTNRVPKSALVSVIKPRIEEIFEYLGYRLKKAGVDPFLGRRVVLTGGASQLAGVREVASVILGKNIRLGKPIHLNSHELSQNSAFSTCAGLLSYGEAEHVSYLQNQPQTRSKRMVKQISSFFKKIR